MIDSHHHLWDPDFDRLEWVTRAYQPINRRFSADDLQLSLSQTPVTATVAVQVSSSPAETLRLLAIAEEDNPVVGVVGWVDLMSPSVEDDLAQVSVSSAKLVGIRHQVQDENDPNWLLREDVERGLRIVERAGLTFDLLVTPRNADSTLALARRHPSLSLVLDHFGKPSLASEDWTAWNNWIRALASNANVTCKLSGLVTQALPFDWRDLDIQRYSEVLIDGFGANRTMFGSDWPVCLLAAEYDEVFSLATSWTAALSASERLRVFESTAAEVYGLHLPTK